jgi:hypothetical protein
MFLTQLDLLVYIPLAFIQCTLVFSVSTLYLLVYTLLHLALEDSSPARFIVFGDFQYMGSVDPVVCSASHTMIALAIELVDRDLGKR